MKANLNILPTCLSMGLIITTLSSAHAADLTDNLVTACKNGTAAKYGHPYIRFKGISGRSSSRKIKLLVIPKNELPYRADCFINAITQEVLTIDKVG